MKNTNKILALLLIGLLSIGNVFAEGFPEEPMVIYGSISGDNIENKSLKIFDGENKLLKQIQILNSKYGTNKTLDITNKISLLTYTGELKFEIDGYNFGGITEGTSTECENKTVFQKGNICEYNLIFTQIIIPVSSGNGGGGGGGGNPSSSVTTTDLNSKESDTTEANKKQETIKAQNNISTVKRSEKGEIIIKGKDYIKTLRMFNSNKKETKTVLGLNVLNIKGDDAYNKNISNYVKEIQKDIKLDSIRKSMAKHLDKMTISYGIFTDSELDENLKEIYKEKLKEDKEYFELKMKKLKRKDEIIRYVLEKRELNSKK